jgi:hypothetical protein
LIPSSPAILGEQGSVFVVLVQSFPVAASCFVLFASLSHRSRFFSADDFVAARALVYHPVSIAAAQFLVLHHVFGLPPGSCRPDFVYRSDFSSLGHRVGRHLQICNFCSLFSFLICNAREAPSFLPIWLCLRSSSCVCGSMLRSRCSAPPPVVCSVSVFSVAVWEARSFVGLECEVVVRSWLFLCLLCLLDLQGLLLNLIFSVVLFVAWRSWFL